MRPQLAKPERLLEELYPGAVVYIPGGPAELALLQRLVTRHPDCLDGVTLVSCLLPGMNTFDYASLHPGCKVETFLLPPALRDSSSRERVRVLPLAYSAIANYLAARRIDVAFLHVTPPHEGRCSLGVAADFGPIVARTARRLVGILNRAMPRPRSSPVIRVDSFDVVVEIDEPLTVTTMPQPSKECEAIAKHVAELVPDGATVQTGIGQAPAAIWSALHEHHNLRVWSDSVGDGFAEALAAGALAPSGHLTSMACGSRSLYDLFDGTADITFDSVEKTHDSTALRKIDQFVAVNSALEVDLCGQVNLEWHGGKLISGVGGAPDFHTAARHSRNGRSIIAMPSSARNGTISRICARSHSPTVALSRVEADTVVTEHGVASLTGLSMDERARALIAIALPAHRPELERNWSEFRRVL